jgi:tight adherence protein B
MWRAVTVPRVTRTRTESRWKSELTDLIARAGIDAVTPGQVVAACAGLGFFALVTSLVVSHSPTISLCFGGFASWSPLALLRFRQRQRSGELRDVWPEIVDNLASAVRAGLSLPEAIAQVGVRGPEVLRPPFVRFGEDYRASGRFDESVDRLKASLADPVGDRIIESIRMAREVGGSDLGRLLRTLSSFLREDARTRAELETRQGWTVNAARLALAAPWLMLGLLSLRPEAVQAYNSATGALVLLAGAGVSLLAYRIMLRIARLPTEQRVLR